MYQVANWVYCSQTEEDPPELARQPSVYNYWSESVSNTASPSPQYQWQRKYNKTDWVLQHSRTWLQTIFQFWTFSGNFLETITPLLWQCHYWWSQTSSSVHHPLLPHLAPQTCGLVRGSAIMFSIAIPGLVNTLLFLEPSRTWILSGPSHPHPDDSSDGIVARIRAAATQAPWRLPCLGYRWQGP